MWVCNTWSCDLDLRQQHIQLSLSYQLKCELPQKHYRGCASEEWPSSEMGPAQNSTKQCNKEMVNYWNIDINAYYTANNVIFLLGQLKKDYSRLFNRILQPIASCLSYGNACTTELPLRHNNLWIFEYTQIKVKAKWMEKFDHKNSPYVPYEVSYCETHSKHHPQGLLV